MSTVPGITSMSVRVRFVVVLLAILYLMHLPVLLAIILNGQFGTFELRTVADCLFSIIPGTLFFLYLKRNVRTVILVYALYESITGISSMLVELYTDTAGNTPMAITMLFMYLLLLSGGIHCYIGDRHSATRLFFIDLIILLIDLILKIPELITLPLMQTIIGILDMLEVFTFIILLIQPGVREELITRRMKRGMVAVESIMSSSSETCIYREDIPALVGIDRSNWMVCGPDSPYESFGIVKVHDPPKEFLFCSRIWKGEDFIRIGIDQELNTDAYGWSFPLRKHFVEETPDGLYLRLYGDDGFFMKIRVVEAPDRPPRRPLIKHDVNELGNLYLDLEEKFLGQ